LAFGTGEDPYAGIDRFSRVVDLRWWNTASGQDVERVQHGYDLASNRLWRQNPVAAAHGVDMDELYGYDGVNQLTSFSRGQLASGQTALVDGTETFAQAWSLDPTGNWSEFQQDSDGSGTWDLDQPRTHNAANEITAFGATAGPQWAAPTYDLAGNMTGLPQPASPGNGFVCVYDAWNRLVRVADATSSQTVAQYQYDGRGYRTVAQTYTSGVLSDTRDFYYSDQWQILEERAGQSAVDRQFVWGSRYVDDLLLRDRDTTGVGTLDERLFGLKDPNWNVTALSDPTGAPVERYRYSAYGEPIFLSGAFSTVGSSSYDVEALYCGYRCDATLDSYVVRNRVLWSHLGRWDRRDPIGYSAADTNVYRYLVDNPLAATDPSGREPPSPVPPPPKPSSWPFSDIIECITTTSPSGYDGLTLIKPPPPTRDQCQAACKASRDSGYFAAWVCAVLGSVIPSPNETSPLSYDNTMNSLTGNYDKEYCKCMKKCDSPGPEGPMG
jgi:RHS repeat-associated protein